MIINKNDAKTAEYAGPERRAANNDDPFSIEKRVNLKPSVAEQLGLSSIAMPSAKRSPAEIPMEGECAVLDDDPAVETAKPEPAISRSAATADAISGIDINKSAAAILAEKEIRAAIDAKVSLIEFQAAFRELRERHSVKFEKLDGKVQKALSESGEKMMQQQRQAIHAEARAAATLQGVENFVARAAKVDPDAARQAQQWTDIQRQRYEEAGGQAFVPLYKKQKDQPLPEPQEGARLGDKLDQAIKRLAEMITNLLRSVFSRNSPK